MAGPPGATARPAPVTPPHWSAPDAPDRRNFDVVDVVGADAIAYLQSQVSQDLAHLGVDAPQWSFVLEPTGKVVALVRLRRVADDHIALDTDGGYGRVVLERINRFRIRVAAEVSLDEGTGVVDPLADQQRITLGWPRHGHEIEPGATIPAETGLVGAAVSFTKGCYPGQELVERMDSRAAAAPVSLRRIVVDPGVISGSPVVDEAGLTIGRITSVADGRALAYVKRGVEIGDPVEFVAPAADSAP